MATLFYILLGLALLYLWLRGWWFAGVVVFLLFGVVLGGPLDQIWMKDAAVSFAPWVLWKLLSPSADRFLAEQHARKQAEKRYQEAVTRPHREWMALPAEERLRLRREWKMATRAERAAIRRRLVASTASAQPTGSAAGYSSRGHLPA